MKFPVIVSIALFWQWSCGAIADELNIEFDDESRKAFGADAPLRVEVVRSEEGIEVRLANASTKHLVITKQPHSSTFAYEKADGSKQSEGGWGVPATPPDFFDHIVLRPKAARKGAEVFDSWSVFTIESSHPDAKFYVFGSTFSGYFPTIDKYLTFVIKGRLDLSSGTTEGEQGVAPQSATRSESKSEDGDQPQPESEPRPR